MLKGDLIAIGYGSVISTKSAQEAEFNVVMPSIDKL